MALPLKVPQIEKQCFGQTGVMISICSIKPAVGKCLPFVDFIFRLCNIKLHMRNYYLTI